MKVIAIDNYDREYISDRLIKENITEEEGKRIADFHNEFCGDGWYHKVVNDDYKLYTFEP